FQPNGSGTNGSSPGGSLRPEYPSVPDMNHQHDNNNNTTPSSATPPLLSDPNNQTARRSPIIGASTMPAIFQSSKRAAIKPVSASTNGDAWSSVPSPRD